MKIIEYNSATDLVIEFQDEYKYQTKTEYGCFRKGEIKNPYFKSIFKVGCPGLAQATINRIPKQSYRTWRNMLCRCYSEESLEKCPTYKDSYVCNEWLCYENFEKWWNENYYTIDGCEMDIEKDILFKGNKIYSPQTCVVAPREINMLFVKNGSRRGTLPIGVSFDKNAGKYTANCSVFGEAKYLGSYEDVESAFYAYKECKENVIKECADKYKGLIPNNLYEAMMKYDVEITD